MGYRNYVVGCHSHPTYSGRPYALSEFHPNQIEKAGNIWYAVVEGWASTYIGCPNRKFVGQEASFMSNFFKDAANASEVELVFCGVDSDYTMVVGEWYQSHLSYFYPLTRTKYPSLDPDTAISYFLREINDSMRPKGILPMNLSGIQTFPIGIKKIEGAAGENKTHDRRQMRGGANLSRTTD